MRALPVVAGDPALDFANTVDDPGGREEFDHVADYRSLLGWSVRRGLLPEAAALGLDTRARRDPAAAGAVVTRAADLREALNDTFGAVVDHQTPDGGWRRLWPYVAEALERASIPATTPPLTLTWDFAELDSPLWAVAEAAGRLVTAPVLGRLKRCGNCPWLFLDSSKNGSRRWCSMEICGTSVKVQRYTARRAERRAAKPG